jgi:hypothetical protein
MTKKLHFENPLVLNDEVPNSSVVVNPYLIGTIMVPVNNDFVKRNVVTYSIKYLETGSISSFITMVDDYGHEVDRFGNIDAKPIIYNKLVYTDKWYNLYRRGPGAKYYDTQEEAIEKGKCSGDDYITTNSIGIYE